MDGVSQAGLEGLSDYVNRRTAATLAEPDAVDAGARPTSASIRCSTGRSPPTRSRWPRTQAAALNDYMSRGGIILIDTRDPAPARASRRAPDRRCSGSRRAWSIPPLAPLTTEHVLARAFYLLQDFPGRFTGDTVWVQRDQDRANDSVSPVIIGGNDWAAAWAVDAAGAIRTR